MNLYIDPGFSGGIIIDEEPLSYYLFNDEYNIHEINGLIKKSDMVYTEKVGDKMGRTNFNAIRYLNIFNGILYALTMINGVKVEYIPVLSWQGYFDIPIPKYEKGMPRKKYNYQKKKMRKDFFLDIFIKETNAMGLKTKKEQLMLSDAYGIYKYIKGRKQ